MNKFTRFGYALLPAILAVAVTAVIVLVVGASPTAVLGALWQGAFGTAVKIADTSVVWVSLAICSAGLLVTFRAGQWNIGVEGQIALGAIGAVWASRLFAAESTPPWLVMTLMLMVGMVLGAVWGVAIGLLKSYGGVNEIFGGLGFNFIATSLTIYLISGPWKPAGTSSVTSTQLLPERLWLPTLEGLRVSVPPLVLAVLVVAAVYLTLNGTIWGLELKAVGRNPRSAFVIGIPTNRILLSAYAVCGLCAGLVGAILVTGVRHQLVANISAGYGFFSILIVLLAGFQPLLTPLVAYFFAALSIGSSALRLGLNLDSSLAGVLQGVLVLSYELVQGVRQKLTERGWKKQLTLKN